MLISSAAIETRLGLRVGGLPHGIRRLAHQPLRAGTCVLSSHLRLPGARLRQHPQHRRRPEVCPIGHGKSQRKLSSQTSSAGRGRGCPEPSPWSPTLLTVLVGVLYPDHPFRRAPRAIHRGPRPAGRSENAAAGRRVHGAFWAGRGCPSRRPRVARRARHIFLKNNPMQRPWRKAINGYFSTQRRGRYGSKA